MQIPVYILHDRKHFPKRNGFCERFNLVAMGEQHRRFSRATSRRICDTVRNMFSSFWIEMKGEIKLTKNYLFKDTFAVIGKAGQGSTDKAGQWIPPLWEEAGKCFGELEKLIPKDENGISVAIWWGLMNDMDETNKRWGKTGKYMTGCEVNHDASVPEGWTKWIIPAQTYLTVECTPDTTGDVFHKIANAPNCKIIGLGHECYHESDNTNVVTVYIPVAEGVAFCQSCSMPMTRPEDFGTETDESANCDYCHHCYDNGVLRKDVTMNTLIADVQKLMDIEIEHPGLLSRSLINYIKAWLSLADEHEKMAAIPALHAALMDGQDCDFTGTQWEKEWMADGKVCHCIACIAARLCIADSKLICLAVTHTPGTFPVKI